MAGIARNIELYNSAFSLAWKHISERQKRERPNIARRLHDSIRGQLKDGATDPLFIASEALKALEESEPEPPKAESAKQPLPFSQRWSHLIRQKKGPNLALTTAYRSGRRGNAVLKPTFAELLRSCSRIIGCARTSPSNLKPTKQPPIASWSHRRQNTQTFAACNRDILPRYTSATFVLDTSGTLEE